MSSAVQADDIALLATTSHAMRNLVHICENNSKMWGFKFSAQKSEVLNFNVTKMGTLKQTVILYDNEIPIVSSTKHVGIMLWKDME